MQGPMVASILVVDDEAFIVKLIRTVLERMGYTVVTACCGQEAVLAASAMETVNALLVDHYMPPDQGRDIAEHLLLRHPAMRVMHMSGFLREHLQGEGQLTPGAAFLSKPFTARQLQQAVASLLAV